MLAWAVIHHMFEKKYGRLKNELIKECIWIIRDGTTSSIWKDHWILDHLSLQLEGIPILKGSIEAIASALMDNQSKWWDVENIRALFNLNIALEILKIIIALIEQLDKCIWMKETGSNFSVKK